MKHVEA
jgi:hypothetical protein